MAKSNEPFWWSLFGAGGMIAALCLPVTILITSILVQAGVVDSAHLHKLFANLFVRVYLFVVISLPLFHWAHRFRFTLYDGLQIKHLNEVIFVCCYGSAIVGTAVAGYLLWTI